MPSSYTTNLRLTLPVQGELSGTWGDTVNTGITALLDSSVAGAASVVMTDADYTLTSVDGATDQARQMFLTVTGTLTAARNVICPTNSKLYFIKNSTTGGFAITLKTSAGTGISIPSGKAMALQVNGTDVVDAVTYFTALDVGSINTTTLDLTNLEVTNIKAKDGTTAITLANTTGVATIAASPIVSSLTASQAVFSNGSKNLVSNAITGTGNVVMSASPTLTGTISAAAANFSGAVGLGDAAADNITVNGTVTSNLIFTDNTYDIGASGATRPRNLFLAGNATVGGNIVLTGALDVTNLEVTNIKAKDGTDSISLADTTGIATFSKATVISTTDNTNAALRITQLGTGNALLVEDAANPDSTPFVIDASGNVISGYTTSVVNAGSATAPRIQVNGLGGGSATTAVTSWSTGASVGPAFLLSRSEGGTIGTQTIVDSGDQLGRLSYAGSDGTTFIEAARIESAVDGTPGTNDMPGRLVFSTTADGASAPTERVRIDSTGQTTFSYNTVISVTDNTNAALRITQLGTGNALLVEDSTNPDSTPVAIDTSGNVLVGITTAQTISGITPAFQQLGAGNYAGMWSGRYSANASANFIYLSKSRSGTVGTNTIVQSGDDLGTLAFYGADGTDLIHAASIFAEVDGTPGTNDMPGRLVFSTTADGASSPTERMRITSAGYVGIRKTPETWLDIRAPDNVTTTYPIWVQNSAMNYTAGYGAYGMSNRVNAGNLSVDYTFDIGGNSIFKTANTERMRIDSAGTVSLAAASGLSIGRTAVTSPATTDGNVYSGTYTPSLTNTTNITSSTAFGSQYMRVGNVVTVSGRATIDPTAAGSITLGMSLPIASTFTGIQNCGGTSVNAFGDAIQVIADTTNNRATFTGTVVDAGNRLYSYSFTYLVA